MLPTKTFLVSVACLALGIQAAPSTHAKRLEDYNIVDIEWEVETTPGGPTVIVNGTVQDVYAHLTTINPNYANEFPAVQSPVVRDVLEARYDRQTGLECWPRDFPACDYNAIQRGINHLNNVSGRPRNGPGPGNCGRVSCENAAGIYWCNDNAGAKELNSFKDIAHGADVVKNSCYHDCDYGDGTSPRFSPCETAGHIFYSENWNVIVTWSKC